MQYFWEKSGWIADDPHLQRLAAMPFKRKMPLLPKGDGLFFIRGPRQIGKSSWLKTMLAELPADKTFYLSCENIRDHLDLAQVFESVGKRKILMLDEISFVDQWWRAVKHRIDSNPKVRLILTGSNAADLKRGMDLMPGRWGEGGEFELLPMEFDEFSAMRKAAGWPALSRTDELELFFRIGGFPICLEEAGPTGIDPKKAKETYRRWLLGDMTKLGKQETYLREMLLQIAVTCTSTLSLQKLAQRTQMGSHNTALDYVETLEACFAVKPLFAVDLDSGAPRFRKEKKFYFRDPLLYWLAYEWGETTLPHDASEKIAEAVAHEYLARRFKRFGYFQDRKGEVDFLSPKKWAIEVKWSESIRNLSNTYKNLQVPNKQVWTKENFLLNAP